MKVLKILFCLLFALISIGGQAQDNSTSLTLQESVQYALQNSPQIQIAQLSVDKNDQLVKEILSSGLPQVNLSGQYVYNLNWQLRWCLPNFLEAPPENSRKYSLVPK